jgi:hypothetical protein
MARPSAQGVFQHVHARLACALARRFGVDAAIADLGTRLADDHRFRYWYDWRNDGCLSPLLTAEERAKLLVVVRDAYARRTQRFPELEQEVESFAAQLQ